jgi:hypothetical protein
MVMLPVRLPPTTSDARTPVNWYLRTVPLVTPVVLKVCVTLEPSLTNATEDVAVYGVGVGLLLPSQMVMVACVLPMDAFVLGKLRTKELVSVASISVSFVIGTRTT